MNQTTASAFPFLFCLRSQNIIKATLTLLKNKTILGLVLSQIQCLWFVPLTTRGLYHLSIDTFTSDSISHKPVPGKDCYLPASIFAAHTLLLIANSCFAPGFQLTTEVSAQANVLAAHQQQLTWLTSLTEELVKTLQSLHLPTPSQHYAPPLSPSINMNSANTVEV